MTIVYHVLMNYYEGSCTAPTDPQACMAGRLLLLFKLVSLHGQCSVLYQETHRAKQSNHLVCSLIKPSIAQIILSSVFWRQASLTGFLVEHIGSTLHHVEVHTSIQCYYHSTRMTDL